MLCEVLILFQMREMEHMAIDLSNCDVISKDRDQVDTNRLAHQILPTGRVLLASLLGSVGGAAVASMVLLQFDLLTVDALLDPLNNPEQFRSLVSFTLLTIIVFLVQMSVQIALYTSMSVGGEVTRPLLSGSVSLGAIILLVQAVAFFVGAATLIVYSISPIASFYVLFVPVMIAGLSIFDLYSYSILGTPTFDNYSGTIFGGLGGFTVYLIYAYFFGDWNFVHSMLEGQMPVLSFLVPVIFAGQSMSPYEGAHLNELRLIGQLGAVQRTAGGDYDSVDELVTSLRERERTLADRYGQDLPPEWPPLREVLEDPIDSKNVCERVEEGGQRLARMKRFIEIRDRARDIVEGDLEISPSPTNGVSSFDDLLGVLVSALDPGYYESLGDADKALNILDTAVEVAERTDADTRDSAGSLSSVVLPVYDQEPLDADELNTLGVLFDAIDERSLADAVTELAELRALVADHEREQGRPEHSQRAYDVSLPDGSLFDPVD